MPYQHYIPATFLANFSQHIENPRRNSIVWVGDKVYTEDPIRKSAVNRVCGQNDIYSPPNGMVKSIDELWNYEGGLPEGIQKLIDGQVDSELWMTILVPFVVSLFIRSTDFEKRFRERILIRELPQERIEINNARTFELQRLLCPILTAQWIVQTIQGDDDLIINDVGFIPCEHLLLNHRGFAIPLDRRHILILATRRDGVLLENKNGIWYPRIMYESLTKDSQINFNRLMSEYSNQIIAGKTKEIIEKYYSIKTHPHVFLEPLMLFRFSGRDLVAYEFTWYRLVNFLERYSKNREIQDFDFSFENYGKYWKIPVVIPANLMEFPSILSRVGDKVLFDCYDTSQYFAFIGIRNLFLMKMYQQVIRTYSRDIKHISDQGLLKKAFLIRQSALCEAGKANQSLIEINENWRADKDFYFSRAICYIDLKKFDYALSDLHKSCSLDDESDQALLNIGTCYLNLNKYDEAQAIFAFLCNSSEKLISSLARLNLALALADKGEHELAISEFLSVDEGSLDDNDKFKLYSRLIDSLFEVKKYSQIPQIIEKLIPVSSGNYLVKLYETHYAEVEQNLNAFMESSNELLKRKLPSSFVASLHSKRSRILFNQGNIPDAISESRKSISNDFFNDHYHSDLAILWIHNDRNLLSLVENVIALLFSDFDGRWLNSIGVNLFTMGLVDIADWFFKKSIKRLGENKEVVRPYRNLLCSLIEKHELHIAESIIEKILKLSPDSIETKIIFAHYYLSKSDHKLAKKYLSSIDGKYLIEKEVRLLRLLIQLKSSSEKSKKGIERQLAKLKLPKLIVNRYRTELKELHIEK